ncbi:YceI family protein [Curtobacterium sp. MCPF17_052]|uniref:YceI family protein n=1 Tax=Curtobacterium sp. MCPF17_052 TaxID=2175655 RepID=UPI003464B36F
MALNASAIPGYVTGTWKLDPTHSEVSFSVRHLAISKVKGKFEQFDATLVTGENPPRHHPRGLDRRLEHQHQPGAARPAPRDR